MSDKLEVDEIRTLIDRIMRLDLPYENKLKQIEALEPVIEAAYALGLTRVKPVRLVTADDLVS